MQLAHGGARVIKVEPPEGDNYRRAAPLIEDESRHFLAKNRGKESISLRIGGPGVDEVLRRLIAKADIVLTNMSPAALVRHGLDYDAICQINPRVIYGAVSAFGHVGPEAHLPGMDVVAQARSGLLFALGAEADGLPLHSEVQAADYATSMLLLAGLATALYTRERTGVGQKVEVSLLAGGMALQGNALHHFAGHDQWREEFVSRALPEMRRAGATPTEIGRRREEMRPDKGIHRNAYRVVRTADSYVAVGAGSRQARERFFEIAGVDDVDDPARADEVTARLDAAIAAHPTDHWVAQLQAAGVPVAEVRHVEELLFDEHVSAEGLIVEVEHELVGRYRAFGAPIRLSATPFDAGGPSPRFARQTRAVLQELGYTDDEIGELATAGVIVVKGE
jgi:crotonobetainyl-CoA:carnitine CoA-transferase CaiB-like acyl-CoA transferase